MVFNLVVQDDPVGFVRGQPGQAERVGAGSHQVDGGHGRGRCGQTTEEGKAEVSRFPSDLVTQNYNSENILMRSTRDETRRDETRLAVFCLLLSCEA